MKSVCVSVALSAFALAGVSSAMAADRDIDINANVSDVCTIAGTQGSAPGMLMSFGTLTTVQLQGTVAPQEVNVGAIACNRSATARLTSEKGALLGPSAGGAGTQNRINYTATTEGLPVEATVNANVTTGVATLTAGAQAVQNAAFSASDVTVQVDLVSSGTNTVVQGAYSDTLTIEVLPQ